MNHDPIDAARKLPYAVGMGLPSLPRVAFLAVGFVACGGSVASEAFGPPDAGTESKSGPDAAPNKQPASDASARVDGREPTVDASVIKKDARAPTPTCTLPPVDVTACTVDTDCGRVFDGCYCGAQPVRGVNVKYVAQVQACETIEANGCALGCATFPGYTSQTNSAIATDPDIIEAFCDTAPESGVCMTRFR